MKPYWVVCLLGSLALSCSEKRSLEDDFRKNLVGVYSKTKNGCQGFTDAPGYATIQAHPENSDQVLITNLFYMHAPDTFKVDSKNKTLNFGPTRCGSYKIRGKGTVSAKEIVFDFRFQNLEVPEIPLYYCSTTLIKD